MGKGQSGLLFPCLQHQKYLEGICHNKAGRTYIPLSQGQEEWEELWSGYHLVFSKSLMKKAFSTTGSVYLCPWVCISWASLWHPAGFLQTVQAEAGRSQLSLQEERRFLAPLLHLGVHRHCLAQEKHHLFLTADSCASLELISEEQIAFPLSILCLSPLQAG